MWQEQHCPSVILHLHDILVSYPDCLTRICCINDPIVSYWIGAPRPYRQRHWRNTQGRPEYDDDASLSLSMLLADQVQASQACKSLSAEGSICCWGCAFCRPWLVWCSSLLSREACRLSYSNLDCAPSETAASITPCRQRIPIQADVANINQLSSCPAAKHDQKATLAALLPIKGTDCFTEPYGHPHATTHMPPDLMHFVLRLLCQTKPAVTKPAVTPLSWRAASRVPSPALQSCLRRHPCTAKGVHIVQIGFDIYYGPSVVCGGAHHDVRAAGARARVQHRGLPVGEDHVAKIASSA